MVISGARKPIGRAEVEQALIDATIDQCRLNSPEAVSIRAVAIQAGVNHGQVHHYFGSKARLVAAAVREIEAGMVDALEHLAVPDMVEDLVRSLSANDAFSRMLCWLLSTETVLEEVGLRFEFGKALMARLVREGAAEDEAREVAARIMAVAAGWPMVRPLLWGANDLDADSSQAVTDAFAEDARRLIERLLAEV